MSYFYEERKPPQCNGKVGDSNDSYQYQETCKQCGKVHFVRTQRDDWPEYYTVVFIECDCGGLVRFYLPVN